MRICSGLQSTNSQLCLFLMHNGIELMFSKFWSEIHHSLTPTWTQCRPKNISCLELSWRSWLRAVNNTERVYEFSPHLQPPNFPWLHSCSWNLFSLRLSGDGRSPDQFLDFGDDEQSFEEMKKKQDEELDFTGKILERKEREKKERQKKKNPSKCCPPSTQDVWCGASRSVEKSIRVFTHSAAAACRSNKWRISILSRCAATRPVWVGRQLFCWQTPAQAQTLSLSQLASAKKQTFSIPGLRCKKENLVDACGL